MKNGIIAKIVRRLIAISTFSEEEKSLMLVNRIRAGGGKVGENVDILNTSIDMLCPSLIEIGDNVTITGAEVLAHDASTKKELGYTKLGKVTIGNNVFVGYGSIILPYTTIGSNVIVGAGTVVAKAIPDNSVVIGNPCKVICTYDEYMQKNRNNMDKLPVFDMVPNEIKDENAKALEEAGRGFCL